MEDLPMEDLPMDLSQHTMDSFLQWLKTSNSDPTSGLDDRQMRSVSDALGKAGRLQGSHRDAFLDTLGRKDSEVRDAVYSILGIFGEGAAPEPAPQPQITITEERIGPYRLTGTLGQGGMGEVFLGERIDGEIELRVAIKVIKMGSNPAVHQRFQSERQILAGFNHPNIAKLLDAGSTPDGRAFLVMELVDGLPIDEYCEQNELDLRDRIELMRKVCLAVAYAHRNLVVHRDLKPSNILVTPDGEPKLLDFGIAKLLDPASFPIPHQDLTQSVMRPMTPKFASPEQILGQPITTSTDVYSLGVLLYLVLTGRLPYPSTPAAVVQRLSESPPRPSEATDPTSKTGAKLDGAGVPETAVAPQLLRGDLDSIVLKSLRPEPEQRYADVGALDKDLRAYLNDEPVSVRRESAVYLLGKYYRRHKWTVIIAVAALLLLSSAVVLLSVQSRTISAERDRARAEEARTRLTLDFLQDLLRAANDSTRDLGAMQLEDLLTDGLKKLQAGEISDPEIAANLMTLIGDSFIGLDALTAADTAYQAAFEQLQSLKGRPDLDPKRIRLLLDSATAQLRRGDAQQFVNSVETAWAIPTLAQHPHLELEVRYLRTDLLHLTGQNLEFLQAQNEILKTPFEQLENARIPLLSSMIHRIQLLISLGRLDEAVTQSYLLQNLIKTWDLESSTEAVVINLSRGLALTLAGHLDQAEATLTDLEPQIETLPYSYQHWTVVHHLWTAKLQLTRERPEEALERVRLAEEAMAGLTDFGPGEPRTVFFEANVDFYAALVQHRLGRSDLAQERGRRGAEALLQFPPEVFSFSLMRAVPIMTLAFAGRPEDSRQLLEAYLNDGLREPDILELTEELGVYSGPYPPPADFPVEFPTPFAQSIRELSQP